jgi:hypothetical protein
MMANAALYLGLARALAVQGDNGTGGLSFEDARRNFYTAARHGLDAVLIWPGVGEIGADRLLTERLIPLARQGLSDLGVTDARGHLDVIEARVRSGQTGAAWQRKALDACDGDLFAMMAAYCEGQRSGAPVHEWDL